MRRAAEAARMSVGGLYHYFPNKRALVLYGLDQEALERGCEEFMARNGHLQGGDPAAMVQAFTHFFAGEAAFIRPAVKAALALGADDFLPKLGDIVNIGLDGFTRTLRLALPTAPESELCALARATRRLFFASLVDWTLTPEKFEEELRDLVEEARTRQRWPTRALGERLRFSSDPSTDDGPGIPVDVDESSQNPSASRRKVRSRRTG